MKIAVIGSGSWGSAVGNMASQNGHEVSYIRRDVIEWPKTQTPDYIFLALPCQVIRARLKQLQLPPIPIVSLTKGIEIETGLRVTQIIQELFPENHVAAVSGPSLAIEVDKGAPTALVAASDDEGIARAVQDILHQPYLRVYRSTDLTGVELGGALKNVYAIAGGVCEGLRAGENGMAGLVTRSLAEMIRIGCTLGGKKETLFGLSGIGDLMLSAYSGISRNHQVGHYLAEGLSLEEITKKVKGVTEGVPTTAALYKIATKKQIKAPVLTEVYKVLYERKPANMALKDLLTRQVEEE